MSGNQRLNLPLLATRSTCSGGTYIVTGSNTGLGFEAAQHLVSLGAATVILAVRDVVAGEKAQHAIESTTGVTGVAQVWPLDLASFASVQGFAHRAIAELARIDALIENAGVAALPGVDAEGYPLAITVNVLSTLLLAVLLLPHMSETGRKHSILPRLVVVGSRVGFDARDKWEMVQDDPLAKVRDQDIASAIGLQLYAISKLFETFAVRYLAPRIPVRRTGVIVNLVCPGLCKTDLARNAPPEFQTKLRQMHAQFGRTAEDGSRTLLHAAVAGEETHGCLLHSCEMGE
ncbi:hypothetical protein ASPZODRAFT_133773 [Penicilliopsis zonata CBS 506.65]|uniref:Ketoreductase (KR) domain-containing protein n=1 Tax=Penicilliopsis zonata CBS 506.65 TaxID=1073090 RepID=A0A1L9SF53_9EURO|nr:hypothetical protein ASPZODRAFT_133773 [Penicilliopsis zonata CBS 506.65]OJJ45905.1 hypothetical protein ASPZODRAFT_133773 [Penicilliopsis zonata CBS 506.65]